MIRPVLDILDRIATEALLALIPRSSRSWGMAMLVERRHLELPRGEAGWWLVSCFRAALTMRLRDVSTQCFLLYVGLGGLAIHLDWLTDAAVPSVALVAAIAAFLAYLVPGRLFQVIALTGGLLPGAHAVANLDQDLWPFYQCQPLHASDWLILGLLFLPATAAAMIGARCRFAIS